MPSTVGATWSVSPPSCGGPKLAIRKRVAPISKPAVVSSTHWASSQAACGPVFHRRIKKCAVELGNRPTASRQGYAGPIKLQVENLPPGVTCQRLATIPAGESALRLEFRTDGTAAEGTATVEVIATANARTADRQKLAL